MDCQSVIAELREQGVFTGRHDWLFIANDTNNFLDWQFWQSWDYRTRRKARKNLSWRAQAIKELGADHHYFIIPEKSIVYHELLPEPLASSPLNPIRPALQVQAKYLLDSLLEHKVQGQLYETGGTHLTSWGSYVVYRQIAQSLGLTPIGMHELAISQEVESGDLSRRANSNLEVFHPVYSVSNPSTRLITPPSDWVEKTSRPLFVMERDVAGPRAVIFRDSMTAGFVDFLAEHFSRSVFIWRRGHVYADIIAREKPDIVIHISTERFVSTLPQQSPLRRLLGDPTVETPET
jgi:hypothetical protein